MWLGYVNGKDAPIAKEDSEYPDWLWGLLSKKGAKSSGKEGQEEEDADLYSKSKKQCRLANKRAALLASSAPLGPAHRKVPLEHQSIDLPAGDGTVAGAIGAAEAREEVRDAMRRGRRKGIKEGNYLKAMR
ncbi:MAG: 60s ribosomal mitochondrial precursor [Lasallia pustulata]|uniref:Large ribosomal subunit protein mL54 n=1 Tax=Lasallia pustulata TaxID=136370 RepID=A0A5M8PTG2_9LECA|nr:MAG: 60s ribosomal mitochondrial precursor [Lasallia pustulata]